MISSDTPCTVHTHDNNNNNTYTRKQITEVVLALSEIQHHNERKQTVKKIWIFKKIL